MNSNELKDKLLKNSDQVMDKLFHLLSGEDDAVINPWEREAIQTLYPTLHHIMLNASDLKKIDATTTNNITAALAKGKITPEQAIKLMSMLNIKAQIDDVPMLIEKLEKVTETQKHF